MMIIAADPGKGTGLGYFDLLTGDHWAGEYEYAEVAPKVQTLIRYGARRHATVKVVCEKYVMTPGTKSAQPDALMHMGAIEWICRQENVPLVWQFPGPAKTAVPDAVLRKLGWYRKTKDGHANDALRHVLLWVANNRPEQFADMIGI
jgi:hypothetical protein